MLSAFKLARLFLVCLAALPIVACDDEVGLDVWTDTPDTVTIYSLSRTDLIGRPSAYDFINHVVVEVESPTATGNWDVALRHEGGQLALVPASGFQGQNSRAALTTITGQTFEGLKEAPEDTARYSSAPVPVQPGQLLVVRTRRTQCGFSAAVRFGKIKILDVNPAAGTVRFETIVNPFCNDRSLIPEDED